MNYLRNLDGEEISHMLSTFVYTPEIVSACAGEAHVARRKSKAADSLEDYISLVEKLSSSKRKQLWFSGCGKVSHKLTPTLFRHKRSKTIDDFLLLEKKLLSRFR